MYLENIETTPSKYHIPVSSEFGEEAGGCHTIVEGQQGHVGHQLGFDLLAAGFGFRARPTHILLNLPPFLLCCRAVVPLQLYKDVAQLFV